MYYTDSMEKAIRCCDYGPGKQEFTNDRIFTVLDTTTGAADGSTIDSQGRLWNAQWGAGRVVCYLPSGEVHQIIRLPVSQPTCVCFGGSDLSCLYITSAHDELSEETLKSEPEAGSLFKVTLGGTACAVQGIPENRFTWKSA